MLPEARYTRMTTRKKTTDEKWMELPYGQKKIVEWRMMGAADAHRLASDLCKREASKYDSMSYNRIFLRHIFFELILVSVEQSLRALLLILFSIFPKQPNHNLFDLYKELKRRTIGEKGIRTEIIRRINDCARAENMSLISEEELVACLEKHRFSYSSTKYFQVDRDAKFSKNFGFRESEGQILYCFVVALIKLNQYKLAEREYKALLGHLPEVETEEELIESAKYMGFLPSDNT